MDTILQGRSKTVVIGSTQPFCIIGERINPTGRKTFADELRNGDLSTVVADTEAQIAAGADVLDGLEQAHAGTRARRSSMSALAFFTAEDASAE